MSWTTVRTLNRLASRGDLQGVLDLVTAPDKHPEWVIAEAASIALVNGHMSLALELFTRFPEVYQSFCHTSPFKRFSPLDRALRSYQRGESGRRSTPTPPQTHA